MEQDPLKFQRLESLGFLAGGIAHDFNNILTAILGNISLAKMYTKTDEKAFEKLAKAEKACLQAKQLSKQLLSFCRNEFSPRKPTFLGPLITAAVNSLSKDTHVCLCSIPHDLWSVELDKNQMDRVLKSVIINSQEAMPRGGVITIKAENIRIEKEDGSTLRDGNYVRVSVADQGCGMSEETLSMIFDLTFTTKEEGRGLGLATVHSLVKRHKGYITVQSQSGVGTNFLIYLPACGVIPPETNNRKEASSANQRTFSALAVQNSVRDLAT